MVLRANGGRHMRSDEGISSLWKKEDWWAVWIGFAILTFAVVVAGLEYGIKAPKIQRWVTSPLDAFYSDASVKVKDWPEAFQSRDALKSALPADTAERLRYTRKVKYQEGKRKVSETLGFKSRYPMSEADRDTILTLATTQAHRAAIGELYAKAQSARHNFAALGVLLIAMGVAFMLAVRLMGEKSLTFAGGYVVVFLLATLAYFIASQGAISAYGLPYALWALLFGLLISNTIGTPTWLLAGSRTELFIKTGLVLLGAEILFGKIVALGSRGLLVAWLVTPCVLVFMYFFGTRVLKMKSKALVVIVAAATSVIFMPPVINAVGMGEQSGGAWMGGTIDSTGAVVAAGALLGDNAEIVAAVIKMIQNVLIGVVAFCIAIAWVTKVERDPGAPRPSALEIWYRFPKFIVGFVAASLVFSFVLIPALGGGQEGLNAVDKNIIGAITKTCRGWLFCLAFVAIGLETNFRQLASQMAGGKPIILYIVGQSFNLILTLLAAYLAFGGWLLDAIPL